jgi:DNA-binding NarL/FixJ family response regulator
VTVVVADDQRVVRDGLVMLLGLLEGIEVLGTAADGDEAVAETVRLNPDVVLMDLNMPAGGGVGATERLRELGSEARVVVLTTHADDESVFAALRAGAKGFLTKDASHEEIDSALRTVAAGAAQFDPSVQLRLVQALEAGQRYAVGGLTASPTVLVDQLTAREVEVLTEIAAGRSNAEIADALFVSESTVKTHVNHLLQKTGMRDRAQLVGFAFRAGIVTG